jgi:multidrug efflux pump subunit AcrA (membrane-fusion protein)
MWIVLVGVAVAAGGWYAYTQYTARQEAAAQEAAAAAQPSELETMIWASGKLTPALWAGLSPALGGTVANIHVKEGDTVKAGDLLLELDNAVLQAQVQLAEAAVSEAEAARAKLLAGATDAQISAAEAEVSAAEAGAALAAGQMLEALAAVQTAQAQEVIAQRQYAELASHPTAGESSAAAAQIAVAQAAVEQAQAAYNLVRGDPNIGAMPQSMALRQATASLEAAQAESTMAIDGPTDEQLSVASGQIEAASAQVSSAESHLPATEAAVKAALARQASAQAALDGLLAGATAEEIAMADAHVYSAQSALASAQANLRQTQIIAPFDGQVGQIQVRPGETISPGAMLILLGDLSTMHVETTDLRETDVVKLREGMEVEVTFDAMPDESFRGVIARVAPVSNTDKGSTNYTIDVDVEDLDPSLRWGMTAFVNIQPEEDR